MANCGSGVPWRLGWVNYAYLLLLRVSQSVAVKKTKQKIITCGGKVKELSASDGRCCLVKLVHHKLLFHKEQSFSMTILYWRVKGEDHHPWEWWLRMLLIHTLNTQHSEHEHSLESRWDSCQLSKDVHLTPRKKSYCIWQLSDFNAFFPIHDKEINNLHW